MTVRAKCCDKKSNGSLPGKSAISSLSPDQSEAEAGFLCVLCSLAKHIPLIPQGWGIPSQKTWMLSYSCWKLFSLLLYHLSFHTAQAHFSDYFPHCFWSTMQKHTASFCLWSWSFPTARGLWTQLRFIFIPPRVTAFPMRRGNLPIRWQHAHICCNFRMKRQAVSHPLLNYSLELEKCL